MLSQFCMGDLFKNREVDLVGQQQIVKFLDDGAKFRRGQGLTVQGQVNVRAGLIRALGAGAVQNRFLDGWKAAEYSVDFFHCLRWQAVVHGLVSG
jgi:hypothetical protein